MTDAIRTFNAGDSVISVSCIVAPPVEPPGVRVEIPLAAHGRVTHVRPLEYQKPYVVNFEIGEGGFVEAYVSADEISAVEHSTEVPFPDELPPLTARRPQRRINRAGLHAPTMRHPHYRCQALHILNAILLTGMYVAFTGYSAEVLLAIALVLVSLMYLYQVTVYRRWSWIPEILFADRPEKHGHVVVDPLATGRAVRMDAVFAGMLCGGIAGHTISLVNHYHPGTVLYVVFVVGAFITWASKEYLHIRAVRIYPQGD